MDGSWQSLFKNEKTVPGNAHENFAKAGEAHLPQCHAVPCPSVFCPRLIAAAVAPFSSSYPLALVFEKIFP